MKNHIKVNGKLLQTNKKFSHLKLKQKEFIHELMYEEYKKYYEENGKTPMKEAKSELLEKIYTRIEERDIWIPFREVEKHFNTRIPKLKKRLDKSRKRENLKD